eukprot:gene4792-21101_t
MCDFMISGFYLSGTVSELHGICLQRKVCHYKVSIKFDRCKITSITCTCQNKSILWCAHAVALAVYRIRFADKVNIRLPLSESILQLKTQQVQSLLLHLVTKHPDLLPSVQNLIDEFKVPNSDISCANGVPDPTAGACTDVKPVWYFDEQLIKNEVKTGLEPNNTGKNISSLLHKVREMFSADDSNAVRLLSLITASFLKTLRRVDNEETAKIVEKVRKICDNLSMVWVIAVLNPFLTADTKSEIKSQLLSWQQTLGSFQSDDSLGVDKMLKLPLKALRWNLDDTPGDVVCAAAYADAFGCHGLKQEALSIAVKVAEKFRTCFSELFICPDQRDGWLGHSLDPISIIFDILRSEAESQAKPDVYLPLAVHVAFAGLGQMKRLPSNKYEQLRLCHREEQLIAQLEDLDFSSSYLRPVICQLCRELRSRNIPNDGTSPSHSFIRFLVRQMIPLDKDLAYSFSLNLLPLDPVISLEQHDPDSRNIVADEPTCHIMSHLESQQSELAATLLKGCYNNTTQLESVVRAVVNQVKGPSQLFRLAKLVNSLLMENPEHCSKTWKDRLITAAVVLGTKAVQLTLNATSWNRQEMIRWLVTSTVRIGKNAVLSLLARWSDLFKPEEMSMDIAAVLTSQPILFQLGMSKEEEKSFFSKLRSIVIESAIQDPPSCALFALTLCEGDSEPFELACQIVNESANRLGAVHLFSIARYLESKGHSRKALKAATLAIKQLDIGTEYETHPAISDVFWACALASSLGKDELTQITPIVCHCIRNPVVLAEIARRASVTLNVVSNGTIVKEKTKFSCNKEPLNRLLATAQQLFVREVQGKLGNISPKFYNDFVKYLEKVKACFYLIDEGHEQVAIRLYCNITTGKTKTIEINQRDTGKLK